jgi:hypothetical protein
MHFYFFFTSGDTWNGRQTSLMLEECVGGVDGLFKLFGCCE